MKMPCEHCTDKSCQNCICNGCKRICFTLEPKDCAIKSIVLNAKRTSSGVKTEREVIAAKPKEHKAEPLILDLTNVSLPISENESGLNMYTGAKFVWGDAYIRK